MATLDPDPTNELGKGILDPAVEELLLAQGCIYAHTLTTPQGRHFVSAYKRPLKETLQSEATSLRRALRASKRTMAV